MQFKPIRSIGLAPGGSGGLLWHLATQTLLCGHECFLSMSSEIHPGPVTQPEDCAGGCWDTAGALTSHCRLCGCKDNVCQTSWVRILQVKQIGDGSKQSVLNGLKEIFNKYRVQSSSPLWSRIKKNNGHETSFPLRMILSTFGNSQSCPLAWGSFVDCGLNSWWISCHKERTLLSI